MTDVAAPPAPSASEDLELYRRELTAHCYRMLGSASEAEDAVQDTMIKAWRGRDRFEGRSALRSWLYRIATNVCLDMLRSGQRRARPMEMTAIGGADGPLGEPYPEATWIEPVSDTSVLPSSGDPADVAAARETIRLAFVAALQHLPPRQRAVLVLREVLCWSAAEVAEALDSTVASVNSALQRARATMAARDEALGGEPAPLDADQEKLVARYVEAFERYDMAALAELLHDDATLSMPPYALWMQGAESISGWMLGHGKDCRGSKLVATSANGCPAFGQYRPSGPDGAFEPWALMVLEVADGRVTGINSFLDTARWFPMFGLPATLD